MKMLAKGVIVIAVALTPSASLSVAAHAQTWNPDNTAVSGVATGATFSYEGVEIVCDTGTLSGTTGINSSVLMLGEMTFEDCIAAGIFDAEVDCEGGFSFIAQDATTNTGTVVLGDDFGCDIVVPDVCVISFGGPQITQNNNVVLQGEGGGSPQLVLDANFQAARSGSELCGPSTGVLNFTAAFSVTPSNLSIDN
jgi:hypothetical protein